MTILSAIPLEDRLRDKPTTAVLRRQVPIRFSEEPRTWLSRLPLMPENIGWPTAHSVEYPQKGEVALNFVAQICCDDLPDNLWGGLGLRVGWLLFLDAHDLGIDDYPKGFQVLHIDKLRSERQPPANIQTVQSPDYSGANYDHVRNSNEVPVHWRKWPVDVVDFNEVIDRQITSELLYPGEKIDTEYRKYRVEDVSDPSNWPFSPRGALYALDCVIRISNEQFKEKSPIVLSDEHRVYFVGPDAVKTLLDQYDTRIAKLEEAITSARLQLETEDNTSQISRLGKYIPLREDWLKEAINFRADIALYNFSGGEKVLLSGVEGKLEQYFDMMAFNPAWRNSNPIFLPRLHRMMP